MSEISKPDYTYLWSSGGSIVAPSNVKIQTGWTSEVPPFQWENWSQNRQDQAIAHILQHGISVWDSSTEYQAGKSYVQGSDGTIYKAVTTNTNQNPVTDTSFTNWAPSSSGSLLRTTIYINTGGVLQASVNGSAFANVSSTYVKHPLANFAEIQCQGGGGGGGNALSTAVGQVSAGSGGGGGGYAFKRVAAGTINGQTIVVGQGGSAATAGGTSSVGSIVTATGGQGGATGNTAAPSPLVQGIAIGGVGSNGDINATGGQGGYAVYQSTPQQGHGGFSMFGAGAQAQGGVPTTGSAGYPAQSYGSGGGGAANGSGVSATVLGGSGKGGVVIIKEYS